jgi:DNA-binding IclR family transcriptional regulator
VAVSASAPSTGGQPLEVVVKADEILGLLSEAPSLSIAEISQGVGEPRSSVYRLIASLEDLGFVEPAPPPGGRFQLALGLFRLGRVVASRIGIRAVALPAMERLFDQTGETVFLMIRHGHAALCVERLDGRRVQSMAVNVGGTLPLHLGAGPMVLLAHSDPSIVEDYLSAGPLATRTPRSVSDEDLVRRRLEEIRMQGFAVSDEDLVPGIAAVGAPIRDAAGNVVASLSIAGARPTVLEESAGRTIELVCEAAATAIAAAD